jgi:hypothetical protein
MWKERAATCFVDYVGILLEKLKEITKHLSQAN